LNGFIESLIISYRLTNLLFPRTVDFQFKVNEIVKRSATASFYDYFLSVYWDHEFSQYSTVIQYPSLTCGLIFV
jgi:hypothetical protein